ncbi:PTS-dependent dihydroxyacetone kinase phosphotransferase subunit DhaM [Dactylosporangium vinaceum]|uniref:phosphoenolpyruvate--glycerone phosphotransferase n=1 Tax=Dactylosporangium vinaceum TaxID=53362 RepID=A0ABV5M086_9ACTN|nr:dihydroxyacetone kinase phosphoryl donor subunit DhaM [Dactylosporangium vinaceum]UAB98175.1 PTS-dependent dihydroxyacetone kinase phosphotransferase subunit DhaM [Dactylosporangium vinaceum]
MGSPVGRQVVGIVLVSHSERLAHGLRDMLVQVAGEEVPIEAAGGTDDGSLGTSYDRILVAIDRADRGAGVLVLTDLGSAVLTARTVLEDRVANDAVLVDAPFVEGAVAAAVLAGTGAALDAVTQAAVEARDVRKL